MVLSPGMPVGFLEETVPEAITKDIFPVWL